MKDLWKMSLKELNQDKFQQHAKQLLLKAEAQGEIPERHLREFPIADNELYTTQAIRLIPVILYDILGRQEMNYVTWWIDSIYSKSNQGQAADALNLWSEVKREMTQAQAREKVNEQYSEGADYEGILETENLDALLASLIYNLTVRMNPQFRCNDGWD